MNIYRKFILLLIIVIFSFIIYKLLQKRQIIINTDEKNIHEIYENFSIKEGLEGNLIVNLIPPNNNFAITQYCIMGSYNTAYTGNSNTITTSAISNVINIGCRFLDFEVYLVGGNAVVAVSNDPTYVTISSSNSMNLSEILQFVSTNAMTSSSGCSNYNDPMFIQFRIKSKNTDIYGLTASAIANTLGINNGILLYNGNLNNLTPIDDKMKGKYIIVIDKTVMYNTNNLDWTQYPICTSETTHCNKLLPFVNIVSGSDNLRTTPINNIINSTTNSPHIFDDGLYTDVSIFQMAVPNLDLYMANPPHSTFVINYGIQIVLYPFYTSDNNLDIYIQMFNSNHSAFVPISTVINYYKNRF
jgi:hypothetical protein